MGLSPSQAALWILAAALELVLAGILFFKQWYRRIPFFSAYIGLVFLSEVFIYGMYRIAGYRSTVAVYGFWTAQLVILLARAAAIGELAWNASRPYQGFRAIVRRACVFVGCLLVLRAVLLSVPVASRLPNFVLALQSGLELTAAALLLLMLVLSRRYDVSWSRAEYWIAIGLLLYSAVLVADNAFSTYSSLPRFTDWNLVRTVSFDVALLVWIFGVGWNRPEDRNSGGKPDPDAVRDFMQKGTAASEEMLEKLKSAGSKR
jgi:hypothetical protein